MNRDTISEALESWDGDIPDPALVVHLHAALTDHLHAALNAGEQDFAALVTSPNAAEPLLLPSPSRGQAEQWVTRINRDSSAATAVLVCRPTGHWTPVE